jgi:hypothetical protein
VRKKSLDRQALQTHQGEVPARSALLHPSVHNNISNSSLGHRGKNPLPLGAATPGSQSGHTLLCSGWYVTFSNCAIYYLEQDH